MYVNGVPMSASTTSSDSTRGDSLVPTIYFNGRFAAPPEAATVTAMPGLTREDMLDAYDRMMNPGRQSAREFLVYRQRENDQREAMRRLMNATFLQQEPAPRPAPESVPLSELLAGLQKSDPSRIAQFL